MRLEGKVAIVTGSGGGIGKGIAEQLAKEGANVVIADISKEKAEAAAAEIKEKYGVDTLAVKVNVADQTEVKNMFEETLQKFDKYDAVVNNAGINRDRMIHKMENEDWDAVIAVNLTGTFYSTQEAVKYLRERGEGSIVNISSGSWLGNIGQANYAASKAGVVGLTKTVARELARKGVTANAICPGFIESDMTKSMNEDAWNVMMNKIPMGYAGQPSDIGKMVAFLISDDARYITGEVINVGGGMIV